MSQPPSLTDLFRRQREAMVRQQLIQRGISDTRVLAAMIQVPRENFTPPHERTAAYDDGALPIGHAQTISQPYTVAFMCEAARLQPADRVLEVGAGSGYGAAVLAQLVRQVHTIERLPELATEARKNLSRCGYGNVTVHVGDGTLGLPDEAPFDAIIVTAGAAGLPEAFQHQLADGGRIVIPIGEQRRGQTMFRLTRQGNHWQSESLGDFTFVPLIGQGVINLPDR